MIYDLGDGVSLRHEVRNAAGTLTAATVALLVTRPDGTTFSPTVTSPSTGVYDAEAFVTDQAGPWQYRWDVSGAVTDKAYGEFAVATQAPGLYVDLGTVKRSLGKLTEDDRDELIMQAIRAACRLIDRRTGRRFYADAAASARTYPTAYAFRDHLGYGLVVDDIASTVGLTTSVGGVELGGIEGGPPNAIALGRPVTVLRPAAGVTYSPFTATTTVTARWGWPSVPDEVTSAAALLAARLYRRKDSPQGVIGSADWGAVRVGRVDPDVEALISHLILPGFA